MFVLHSDKSHNLLHLPCKCDGNKSDLLAYKNNASVASSMAALSDADETYQPLRRYLHWQCWKIQAEVTLMVLRNATALSQRPELMRRRQRQLCCVMDQMPTAGREPGASRWCGETLSH